MCKYATEFRQDFACDKLVLGLINNSLKERLLHKKILDLATAVGYIGTTSQIIEASHKRSEQAQQSKCCATI